MALNEGWAKIQIFLAIFFAFLIFGIFFSVTEKHSSFQTSKMANHEAKPDPTPLSEDKVVLAFGALKAPTLVSQISQTSNPTLRLNALKVLAEELRNPYSAGGVTRAGVVAVLNDLITSGDKAVKLAASKALGGLALGERAKRNGYRRRQYTHTHLPHWHY